MVNRGTERTTRTKKRKTRKDKPKTRRSILRYVAIGGVAVIGILVIAGLIIPSIPSPRRQPVNQDMVQLPGLRHTDMGQGHFGYGEKAGDRYYNSIPPTSGMHSAAWERCGEFNDPLEDEVQVHNLEHGFVIVQYRLDDEEGISALRSAVEALPGYPEYYIFAPYPKMYPAIALSSWSVVQYLEEPDMDIMIAFANAYRGKGPEPGAPSCAPGGGM